MFLTCWNPEVLFLSCRETLQNGVEAINIVSSKSSSFDSTASVRSLIDIAMASDTFAFVEDCVGRRRGNFGGDGLWHSSCESRLIVGFGCSRMYLAFFVVDGLQFVGFWLILSEVYEQLAFLQDVLLRGELVFASPLTKYPTNWAVHVFHKEAF